MTASNTPATLRMGERAIIVLGGILSIYLGYRLFELGITTSQGEAQAFGITLRSFAPGLFFAGLGAYVLVTSLNAGIKTGVVTSAPAEQSTAEVPAAQQPERMVERVAAAATASRDAGTSTFFFGLEDDRPDRQKWAAKSFFLETRDLLRNLDSNSDPGETVAIRETLKKKLTAITMTPQEYQRYQVLTNQVEQTPEEQKEYLALEAKLFP